MISYLHDPKILSLLTEVDNLEAELHHSFRRRREGLGLPSAVQKIDSGHLFYNGNGSPLTQAMGLGSPLLNLSEAGEFKLIGEIERFYKQFQEPVNIELNLSARLKLFQALVAKGYSPVEQSSLLVGSLDEIKVPTVRLPDGYHIRPHELGNEAEESSLITGFGLPVNEHWKNFQREINGIEGHSVWVAYFENSPVGGGSLFTHGQWGYLSGASVLPEHRGIGLHKALTHFRIKAAEELGLKKMAVITPTASISEGNLKASGFEILGVRMKLSQVKGSLG